MAGGQRSSVTPPRNIHIWAHPCPLWHLGQGRCHHLCLFCIAAAQQPSSCWLRPMPSLSKDLLAQVCRDHCTVDRTLPFGFSPCLQHECLQEGKHDHTAAQSSQAEAVGRVERGCMGMNSRREGENGITACTPTWSIPS